MVQIKPLSKLTTASQVVKMLQHFENYKFIKMTKEGVQFGFLSVALQDFIRKEWLHSNLVASDWPAFLFNALHVNQNLKTSLEDIKSFVSTVPFSIVEVDYCQPKKEQKPLPEETNAVDIVSNQFKRQSGTILRNHTFCSQANAFEIFHKKQRERKNWWRKFAAVPGRFVISNVSNKENDRSVISEIQAEFPWGLESVETIKYLPDFNQTQDDPVEVNITKRKRSIAKVVSCEAIIENMTFAYLCDSYGKLNGSPDRDVLKFARNLAPFKLAVAGSGSTPEAIKSLEELSLLLTKQVRKLGFPVLFLPDACTTSIERQLLRNDALGVPYTLLLNDETLQVGTVSLRSRDTTLQEDSHVSIIGEYLGKILK